MGEVVIETSVDHLVQLIAKQAIRIDQLENELAAKQERLDFLEVANESNERQLLAFAKVS